MILIIGGAYQGKLAYAQGRFPVAEDEIYYCGDSAIAADMPENKKLVYEIDKWILALVRADIDVEPMIRRFIAANPEAVVIANDISSGVVPADPVLRRWREATGRSLAALSESAEEVQRLFCGIPTRLK